ncbi:hypothetical protein HGB07_00405 [Candidatus Roizmanbacteria bacterium]|nr:hypothetical protein [Candidatus Roizmanbacteria bacterium]
MNQRELLFITIGIFLTIVAGIVLDVYHVRNKSSLDAQIKPVQSVVKQINTTILDDLQSKTP